MISLTHYYFVFFWILYLISVLGYFLQISSSFLKTFSNFAAKQPLTMEQKFGAVRAESNL